MMSTAKKSAGKTNYMQVSDSDDKDDCFQFIKSMLINYFRHSV